jgi:hypothetical protein
MTNREKHDEILGTTTKSRGYFTSGLTIKEARKFELLSKKIKAVLSRPDVQPGSEVYVFESCGKLCYATFRGKSAKSENRYSVRNQKELENAVSSFFASCELNMRYKADQKATTTLAKSMGHGLEVGFILSGSWGYDQTNVEFFQIVSINGSMCEIQEVAQETAKDVAWAYEIVVPDKGNTFGKILRRKIQVTPYGVSVRLHDSCSLSLWRGEAMHQTSYA